ncbi:MAG: hypothetical protein Q7S23_01815 [bacterium]|nr:hypothetical protein [bacterium]
MPSPIPRRRATRRRTAAAGWLTLAVALAPLQPAAALVFSPNRLMTDAELHDPGSLSTAAIQQFLEQKGSVLATFRETVEGQTLTAAQIFSRVGNQTGISPKFLLAVVEREKGLLRKSPGAVKQSDLDWAAGYSCFSGRCNEKYRGFFNQVDSAAITQNIYFERASTFTYRIGTPAQTHDGYTVTPENQATANLYIYTPFVGHSPELGIVNGLGGNRLFHNIWQQFFTDAKYPEGLVLTDGTTLWRVEAGKKRKFATRELFAADHRPEDAITVTPKVLSAYPDGPDIRFANYTVVRSAASGQALLLQNGKQRPIVDEQALALLSDFHLATVNLSDIPAVAAELLEPYPVGLPVTANLAYPQGKLFKDDLGTLVWVQDSVRHPVHDVTAQINFYQQTPEATTAAALERYPIGSPVLLRDGTLVKNTEGTHYLITNGERRKITSTELAARLLGNDRVTAALTAPDDLLELHGAGLNMDYINDTIQDPAATPTPAATPAGPLISADSLTVTPASLVGLTGQSIAVQATVRNAGTKTWQAGEIKLQLNGGAALNFLESSVAPGEMASFNGPLTYTAVPGLQPQTFTVLGPDGAVIARFAKFAVLKPAAGAEVTKHTLPTAVKTSWKPVPVAITLKNTTPNLTWKASKAALVLKGPSNQSSPFYDPADWVKTDVPAVPTNRKTIKPGETGEFRFTLRPRGVKPGLYELHFQLQLRDAKKDILINGGEEWVMKVRVDK